MGEAMIMKVSQQSQLIPLYQCIEALVEKPQGKLILFLSGHAGEGVSTIAEGLGELCAGVLGRSVLVMEACGKSPDEGTQGTSETNTFHRHSLKVADGQISRDVLYSDIAQSRDEYDYVLLVSPPLSEASTGLELAQHADGVVLIIEAESTRWKTSRRMCDEIIGTGGNLLGIVLNKRRQHLPAWLARWL